MPSLHRILLGAAVSLVALAVTSELSAAGLGALLAGGLALGWIEWRAWRKR